MAIIAVSSRTPAWTTVLFFLCFTSCSSPVFSQVSAGSEQSVEAGGDLKPGVNDTSVEESNVSDESRVEKPADGQSLQGLRRFEKTVDDFAGMLVGIIASVFFFDVLFFMEDYQLPLAVFWLVCGATFFTIKMRFINIRGFSHAIAVALGKYDDKEKPGEVSHFQALTSALSATVGLGNIAGVAIAVSLGGPGATFWMIIAGLLGMSSKFAECTLGQRYRQVRPDGSIMGGAMYYLSRGLAEMKLGPLGTALAICFAILCIGGSFGGGCAFQVNQSMQVLKGAFPDSYQQNAMFDTGFSWAYGILMAVLVGLVILGGIRRIAATAEKIVPTMCGIYVLACMWILFMNLSAVPAAFAAILQEAFTPEAGYGGFIGVLVTGFKRAAFSNEAGVGSAPIAHSAARTDYPVREGIVALLEPFIDTIIVCTMTALVIVITGAYANPEYKSMIDGNQGAALTSEAMREQISWFPYVLCAAVVLFAYSTMISWSYYGERCWVYLFGDSASQSYRILFLIVVFLGSIISASNVLDLSDLMILGMAFPNVLGVILLSNKVKQELDEYWAMYRTGEFTQNSPEN